MIDSGIAHRAVRALEMCFRGEGPMRGRCSTRWPRRIGRYEIEEALRCYLPPSWRAIALPDEDIAAVYTLLVLGGTYSPIDDRESTTPREGYGLEFQFASSDARERALESASADAMQRTGARFVMRQARNENHRSLAGSVATDTFIAFPNGDEIPLPYRDNETTLLIVERWELRNRARETERSYAEAVHEGYGSSVLIGRTR